MKKKRNKHKQLNNEKVMRAQHKAEFMRKFKHYFVLISDEQTYKMIPNGVLDNIYERRASAVRVIAAEGQAVPSHIVKNCKKLLSEWLKNIRFSLIETSTQEEITVDDYFTVLVTIIRFLRVVRDDDFHTVAEIKRRSRKEEYMEGAYQVAMQNLSDVINLITGFNNNLGHRIYWATFEVLTFMNGKEGTFQIVKLHSYVPEKFQANIDGVYRPASRVAWGVSIPNPYLRKVDIAAKDLGGVFTKSNKTFEVYIQAHALQRLSERLDNIHTGVLHNFLIESLIHPVVHRDAYKNIFIEYRLDYKKVGYLLITFSDAKIIVKTFLFLTNAQTPEGDKLLANTGLSIEDTRYLSINKLSAFMASDIAENEKVKQIFIDAGCGNLFDTPKDMVVDPEKLKTRSIAALIADYIGLNADDFDFEEETDTDLEPADDENNQNSEPSERSDSNLITTEEKDTQSMHITKLSDTEIDS